MPIISLYIHLNTIAIQSLHINELKNTFADDQQITVTDIIEFYRQYEKKIKRSTIDWRIYSLSKKGILYRVSRGTYTLSKEDVNLYTPEITKSLKLLYNKIHNIFPFIDICLWSTKWLNEFMLHQPGKFHTLVEVDKDVMESVFYSLKDQGKNVFLNPSIDIFDKYIIYEKNPIIITRLTTEAPVQKIRGIKTITIEKMLVDIYCDPVLFSTYQGAELLRIYKNAFEKYNINRHKVYRYADRRNKKKDIINLIDKIK
ncbi:DUF6577 family protein [Chondrinema litorale]|uniref:DUF6577 family protein n=1 Tax=Chondrinema litorale TaxID=2994555 RepID=UPI002543D4D7|nr:DUF6577 family protein [Chondrinema litorale]UZS00219.1 hypothetical protein OQ292_40375 [Chondrinema litorale]